MFHVYLGIDSTTENYKGTTIRCFKTYNEVKLTEVRVLASLG